MNDLKRKMKHFQVLLTLVVELVIISELSILEFTYRNYYIGQCTLLLADYFTSVYGFDVAESQINQAKRDNQHSNVFYMVS